MTRPPARTGICLVRLEEQGDRILITLLTTPDLRNGCEMRQSFVDTDQALGHIREFVEAFRAGFHGAAGIGTRPPLA